MSELTTPPARLSETPASAHGEQLADARPFGIVIAVNSLEFIIVGQGAMLDFAIEGAVVEIDAVRELRHTPEGWIDGRVLNGDERLTIVKADEVTAARITLLMRPSLTLDAPGERKL